jgi:thiamine-phosphate pyrophosphorylase
MNWRRRQLRKSKLYIVLDKKICSNNLIEVARQVINAGSDIIQLRYKDGSVKEKLKYAKILRSLSKDKSLFIVNDDLDVAIASGADGVHLGQDDIPIAVARRILGKQMLIGISCHNLTQARKAQVKGADYIGIGPIFSTPLKPRRQPIGLKILSHLQKKIEIPFFAIGGINQKNIKEILNLNIKTVALIRAVCKSENINQTINNFKILLR